VISDHLVHVALLAAKEALRMERDLLELVHEPARERLKS
jgi:hypothetical protein